MTLQSLESAKLSTKSESTTESSERYLFKLKCLATYVFSEQITLTLKMVTEKEMEKLSNMLAFILI